MSDGVYNITTHYSLDLVLVADFVFGADGRDPSGLPLPVLCRHV